MTRGAIILASGSAIRAEILRNAGVPFTMIRPDVDEAAFKRAALAQGLDPEGVAQGLADVKALAVDGPRCAAVIGADQIMEFEGRLFDKPATREEARARLLGVSGRPHTLINAVSIARAGKIVFRSLERPVLHMRALSAAELDAYFAEAGAEILASVGAYQVEKLGARLFERIEGDYFAVLGLSLYPLLGFLRREGYLPY
jgi:septum formation protein